MLTGNIPLYETGLWFVRLSIGKNLPQMRKHARASYETWKDPGVLGAASFARSSLPLREVPPAFLWSHENGWLRVRLPCNVRLYFGAGGFSPLPRVLACFCETI